MIVNLILMYVIFGLVFMVTYMVDVGNQISEKYSCSLLEGITRFERAGSMMSNIEAVLICVAKWPHIWWSMKTGIYQECIQKMVEENDYT